MAGERSDRTADAAGGGAERAGGAAEERRVFHTLDRVNPYPYSLSSYAARFAWTIVQATLFRWSLPRMSGWRRMLLRLFGAKLHPTSKVGRTAIVQHPWLLEIGEQSDIADRVRVYNLGPIRMGRHSVVSQDAYLCAGTHDYTKPTLPLIRPPITIGDGVWVCSAAFVGPGVTIGHNSIVGAAAVVMRDVPDGVIVSGNPAAVVRPRPMGAPATLPGDPVD